MVSHDMHHMHILQSKEFSMITLEAVSPVVCGEAASFGRDRSTDSSGEKIEATVTEFDAFFDYDT